MSNLVPSSGAGPISMLTKREERFAGRELQRLLRDLREKEPPNYLIVYKIDRWARDSVDGILLVQELRKRKVQLVSAGENIDDSPEGRMMLTILLGVTEYESTGKAVRIRDNMRRAAENGVTNGKAAVGYLNQRHYENGQELKSIEIDPERAPHVQWAFEAYASGEWTLRTLTAELEARGLTTAPSRAKASRPLTISHVGRMLRSPYYLGMTKFDGIWYQGRHQPLVTQQLFDRVGAMLSAKNFAGEKTREHPHYLKGTVFCGGCGSRLCIQSARGNGGTYLYFFCLGRNKRRTDCTQGVLSIDEVEEAVERFYGTVELAVTQLSDLRELVAQEVEAVKAGSVAEVERQTKRLAAIKEERAKLLQAHYAGAIPLDMLKDEMARIERETADATRLLASSQEPLEDIEERLADLERFIGSCHRSYLTAGNRERRHINQALFEKLLVSRDGVVAAVPAGLIRGLVSLPEVDSGQGSATGEVLTGDEADACRRKRANHDPVDRWAGGSNLLKVVLPQGQHSNTEIDRDGSNVDFVVQRSEGSQRLDSS